MKKTLEILSTENLPIQPSGKAIGQTVRNALKSQLVDGLVEIAETVKPDNAEVLKVDGGVVVSMFNEKLNKWVAVVLEVSIKNFDFDAVAESEAYEEKVETAKKKKAESKKGK